MHQVKSYVIRLGKAPDRYGWKASPAPGREQSLADCPHPGWGQHNCYHYEDVAIRCPGPDALTSKNKNCNYEKL